MDRTVTALESLHARLLHMAEGPEQAQSIMALAASVPQLAAVIEQRVPKVDASILTRDQVRDLLVEVVAEVLQAQAESAKRYSAHR